jgi:hypothetical protein
MDADGKIGGGDCFRVERSAVRLETACGDE